MCVQKRRRGWLLWTWLSVGLLLLLTATALWLRALFFPSPPPLAQLETVADIPLAGGSSRLDYQSLDEPRRLLFIAHLGASMVSVFDVAANKIVANIGNIADVHGILAVPELGRVYASATGSNEIAVINEHSLRVIATIEAGGYPDGMAYDPADQKLFVSDETGQTETVIDTNTNHRIATIQLGGEVGNTQYDPVSHRVFVDVQTKNQVVAIDPATNQITATYDLPGCQNDHSLLLDVAGRLAFVACDENNKLLVLEMSSMSVLSTFSVGQAPDVLALDSQEHLLYVSSESGTISVFSEQRPAIHKVLEGFVAPEAHTIAVDEQTHLLYLPLENVGGQPVLRIARLRLPTAALSSLLPPYVLPGRR